MPTKKRKLPRERSDSPSSDLSVQLLSKALTGVHIDLIVCGSIGAVESVRFIRSLRRLGAEVHPWLSQGGAQFITKTSLAWAAAQPVRDGFSGEESHIASGDICIVAPASANFIYKLAYGITDTPTAALAASYLGQKKKIIVVPNMHESLFNSPAIKENIEKVSKWGVVFSARQEEGKRKFPEPSVLADHVAHEINAARNAAKVLVTMGSTRGYLDDVRYLSNYSSGALGTLITEELYRYGLSPMVVCGPCPIEPKVYSELIQVQTNSEMLDAAQKILKGGAQGAILAASVLDFIPEKKQAGKIRSNVDDLTVKFNRTEKLIASLNPSQKPSAKIGFKLETDLNSIDVPALAKDYMQKYHLSQFVVNQLSDVSSSQHKALVFDGDTKAKPELIDDKRSLSAHLCQHLLKSLNLEKGVG